MGINRFLLKTFVLCLVMWGVSLAVVKAQEPVAEEEQPLVIAPSGRIDLTLKQLGYETRLLNQGRNDSTYQVYLPGNLQILPTGNYFNVITSHLPPNPDKPALLRVSLNGQLLSTLPLTVTNAVSNTLQAEIPADLLRLDRNNISVDLDTGATCEDPGAFLDVQVDEESTLSLAYQQIPYPADLGLYPFPFTEQSLLNIPVTIVLPERPTSTELSAAATVAMGLGQASGGSIQLNSVTADQLTAEIQANSHLIVIGKPESNVLFDDLDLLLPIDDTTLEPGQGILEELVSPWNEFRLVLVVGGVDDEGVLKASGALNRQAKFLGMRGPVAVVIELAPLSDTERRRSSSFSLASLNYNDQIFYGTLPQTYRYDFELPLGWQLAEAPYMVLKFAHADVITPESALDVKLNGTPIGSTLLDGNNRAEGELNLPLPVRLLKTGGNRLEVNVEMNLPNIQDKCQGIGNERAWTVVSNASEIFLPYETINLEPNLGLFPYPFSQFANTAQTVMVLPDEVSSQLVNQLLQLSVRLGSAKFGLLEPAHVSYISELDQALRQENHLIVLGRPTENSILAEINDNLPLPFVTGSDLPEPLAIDTVAFLPDPDRDAGLLQIIQSPWNEGVSLLAVTGTTDEGVNMAVQALLEQTDRLDGNLAVIEPAQNLFSDEPNQLSTYSIDTRPSPLLNDQESSTPHSTLPEETLSALANRWWK